jgi:hypothetical protein
MSLYDHLLLSVASYAETQAAPVQLHAVVRALLLTAKRAVLWVLLPRGLSVIDARNVLFVELDIVFQECPQLTPEDLEMLRRKAHQHMASEEGELLDAGLFRDAPRA